METDKLYRAIFERRSVRKYEQAPLDEKTLEDISSFMSDLRPLWPGIRTELRFMKGDEIKGMFRADAPHYLVLFSEEKEGYQANAGFMLQQMDLYLSSKGLGCCWQGGPKPVKSSREVSGMTYVILLAFGRASEDVHRKDISEFKRDPLEKITDIKEGKELLEPARLAPSAMNNQPWYFSGTKDKFNAYGARSLMLGDMNQVSVGIALCHIWLAAENSGRTIEIVNDPSAKDGAPKGRSYIGTVIVGKTTT